MQIQKTHQNRAERTTYQGTQTVPVTSPTSLALLVCMPMGSYVFIWILVFVCVCVCMPLHIYVPKCIYVSGMVLICVPWVYVFLCVSMYLSV